MNLCSDTVARTTLGAHSIESYEPLIGDVAVERILNKSKNFADRRIAHISSTYYGGGVAEILTPLTLLSNAIGIDTDWRLIQGTPAFFLCTKMLHNAMPPIFRSCWLLPFGGAVRQRCVLVRERESGRYERAVYEQVAEENSMRLHLEDCNAIIVHDPQPLPLITKFVGRTAPWIWQCHVDLSAPDAKAWHYLKPFVEQYDLAVVSLPDYRQELKVPQRFITPAIDPFSAKNCELSEHEAQRLLARHEIPTDRPIVAQVSRFDRWKDPAGVIEAFRRAQREVDCTLVLLGSPAVDDPEASLVLESLESSLDDRVHILTVDDPLHQSRFVPWPHTHWEPHARNGGAAQQGDRLSFTKMKGHGKGDASRSNIYIVPLQVSIFASTWLLHRLDGLRNFAWERLFPRHRCSAAWYGCDDQGWKCHGRTATQASENR